MLRLPRGPSIWLWLLVAACGGSVWVQKGDALRTERRYGEAIEAYERALRENPDDAGAEEGIAAARHDQALEIVMRAERALGAGHFVDALRDALRARAMPLDLDDVGLARRIDRAVESISARSDEEIQRWLEADRYLDAAQLAEQLVRIDSGRQDWAESIRRRAAAHYVEAARAAEASGYPGSAALRLALGRELGADVERARIASTWAAFQQPSCFASPELRLRVTRRASPDAVAHLRATVRERLLALQSRCGEGSRPLDATVRVDAAEARSKEETIVAAEPLPGVDLVTEEVYYEEVPYTEVEEVTTYETRVELVEHRDCAPRPGHRGCRTWTEEIEKRIPNTQTREVQKVRRVKRTRPVSEPLPDDQVVRYPRTVTARRVRYEGRIDLPGLDTPMPFSIIEETLDQAHGAVNERGVQLAADPMEALTLEELLRRADRALAQQIDDAIEVAMAKRGTELELRAQRLSQEDEPAAAEEAHLAKLVIGGEIDRGMARFFEARYGRSVSEVLRVLLVALGRAEEREERDAAPAVAPALFPNDLAEERGRPTPTEPAARPESSDAVETDPAPSLPDSELRALEEASLDAADSSVAPVDDGPPAPESPEPVEPHGASDDKSPVSPRQ